MADDQHADPHPAPQPAAQPNQPPPTPPFQTAAEIGGIAEQVAAKPKPGLSFTPGLQELPGSQAPSTAKGDPVSHVFGPQQAPVDPVAAGLDTQHVPLSRAENRMITQTGEAAAGPRPFTYVEKTGPDQVPQAAPADGALVKPPSDAEAAETAGPASVPSKPA